MYDVIDNINLYSEIPRIEDEYIEYPVKLFYIDINMMDAFAMRCMYDDNERRGGTINPLDGPNVKDDFLISYPANKLFTQLMNQSEKRSNDEFKINERYGFVLGAIDIVTYPFYYALLNDTKLDNKTANDVLWKINSNLVNEYFPSLNKDYGVMSIVHVKEDPIDDAPVHNLVSFVNMDSNEIKPRFERLCQSEIKPTFVCLNTPIMDDRYLPAQRREGDGKPFDLSIIKEAINETT